MTFLLSGAWWAARLAMGTTRAAQIARGPLGGALGVTMAAVVMVAALAVGLAWLRGDAARDQAVACDVRQHQAALAAEVSRRTATEHALAQSRREIEVRHDQQSAAEVEIARLEHEKGLLRAKADEAAGSRDVVFRADDAWLRQGTGAPASRAPAGR